MGGERGRVRGKGKGGRGGKRKEGEESASPFQIPGSAPAIKHLDTQRRDVSTSV